MKVCIQQDLQEKEKIFAIKEYSYGENVASIDWRKSASSKILIKQNGKELSKTIYLYLTIVYQ